MVDHNHDCIFGRPERKMALLPAQSLEATVPIEPTSQPANQFYLGLTSSTRETATKNQSLASPLVGSNSALLRCSYAFLRI